MRTFYLLLFSFFFISSSGSAQGQPLSEKTIAKRKSYEQIVSMQKGALLVRLKTRQRTIDLLYKNGKQARAEELTEKQSTYNQSVIKAFRANFEFCEVQFFFSNYSNDVRNKTIENIVFLNDSLEADSSIIVTNSIIFVADINQIESDTNISYIDHYEILNTENGAVRVPIYYGGANMGFEALLIKNTDFYQLQKPFPYYERTLSSIPFFKKPMRAVVKDMNDQLFRHLKKAINHIAKLKKMEMDNRYRE